MTTQTFETSDLALCATLHTLGYSVVSMDRNDPRRVLFLMSKTDALEQAVQDFWDRKLLVEPGAYFQSLRLLKSRIRQ